MVAAGTSFKTWLFTHDLIDFVGVVVRQSHLAEVAEAIAMPVIKIRESEYPSVTELTNRK